MAGAITPVEGLRMNAPLLSVPVVNVPPDGVTEIVYGAPLLHNGGIAVIVGVSGLITVMETVLLTLQLPRVEVAVTV